MCTTEALFQKSAFLFIFTNYQFDQRKTIQWLKKIEKKKIVVWLTETPNNYVGTDLHTLP